MKEKQIRLCIISPKIYSLFNNSSKVPFGGAEVQLYLLSKEFSKDARINVSIITGDMNLKHLRLEAYDNLQIYVSQPLSRRVCNFIRRPINLLSILIKLKPDVIIQRVASIETFICALYSIIFQKKFIYSIAHNKEVLKNGLLIFLRIIFQFSLYTANIIITQSYSQYSYLRNLRAVDMSKVKVIRTAYEINDINLEDKKFILWVGRAVNWKRGELFLKIAKNFPQETFIMICMKGRNVKYFNKIYGESNRLENLKFIQFVPFKNIDPFFKTAKIFINTSIYEGFPNTFIQALKNKTPIISLNVDPDNLLTKNKCGFNCKNDYLKLKKYLNKILLNEKLYKDYTENAFEYAKKNHDIKDISKKWIYLIKNIIKN